VHWVVIVVGIVGAVMARSMAMVMMVCTLTYCVVNLCFISDAPSIQKSKTNIARLPNV